MNIAQATEFTIINALSFHIIETHNHPKQPKNCKNILYGNRLFVVAIIAITRIIDEAHLIYHTTS
jgi:hypothetical protein